MDNAFNTAGLTLGEARGMLADSGIEIEKIIVTAPPKNRNSHYDDSYRVIKQMSLSSGKVELLICKPLIK